jgi:hypothetical protein
MAENRDPRIGDSVTCVSGPHEGRSGILTQLREIQAPWKDPEWYGVVAYEQEDSDGKKFTDHFALPVKRLKPRG